MALHKKIARLGGSLAVVIPRDIAEAMGVTDGAPVRLSVVGRQMVVEPEDDTADASTFKRAFAAVLRRHGPSFKALADFDAGLTSKPRRGR